jgi:hypothetical protein
MCIAEKFIHPVGRSSVSAASLDPTDHLLAMASGRVEFYTSAFQVTSPIHE